jgi:hypothetical protein
MCGLTSVFENNPHRDRKTIKPYLELISHFYLIIELIFRVRASCKADGGDPFVYALLLKIRKERISDQKNQTISHDLPQR